MHPTESDKCPDCEEYDEDCVCEIVYGVRVELVRIGDPGKQLETQTVIDDGTHLVTTSLETAVMAVCVAVDGLWACQGTKPPSREWLKKYYDGDVPAAFGMVPSEIQRMREVLVEEAGKRACSHDEDCAHCLLINGAKAPDEGAIGLYQFLVSTGRIKES